MRTSRVASGRLPARCPEELLLTFRGKELLDRYCARNRPEKVIDRRLVPSQRRIELLRLVRGRR